MIETYGQRYAITWRSFRKGQPIGEGSLKLTVKKPRIVNGLPMSIRSQALLKADQHLRQTSRIYQMSDSWSLGITTTE